MMRRTLSWLAIDLAAVVLAACGGAAPTRRETLCRAARATCAVIEQACGSAP